jgi:predicted nucleic acid-binding protein
VRFLCDTTVLFAASDAAHHHHHRSLEVVARASRETAFIAAHSLAELYATLSAIAAPKLRRVAHVLEAVEHAATVFTAVTLSAADYLWVVRHVASVDGRSGQIYDALILKCADVAGVDVVYTWNTVHFRRIAWPMVAERIRSPG